MRYTKKDILEMVEEEDVEFVRLQFTDLFGNMKNVAITASHLKKALDNKVMFDGSSAEGFVRVEESDMYLYPDYGTFATFPWRPQQGKVARLICDVYRPDGTCYEGDPRYILKKVVSEAAALGYTFNVGPECEFFLYHVDDDGMPTTITHEQAGYFDMGPLDFGENARRDMVLTLEDMGFEVESSHHENAPAQHEIDFKYDEALQTADNISTFKLVVKTIAKRHGLHATFMPKPRAEVNGSGMHLNMRLLKDGKNIFKGEDGALSAEGEAFLAGILYHIQGMTAVMNPLVNSYKRLVPGFEAPSEVTWSRTQRNALVHVRKEHGGEVNLELRSPDSASNPYLVFALCLAAGMEGIEKGLQVPEELTKDIRNLNEEEKKLLGIQMLPENLGEAIKAMGQDTLVSKVLGETYRKGYMKAKRKEWKDYLEQVSEWELNRYLYRV